MGIRMVTSDHNVYYGKELNDNSNQV